MDTVADTLGTGAALAAMPRIGKAGAVLAVMQDKAAMPEVCPLAAVVGQLAGAHIRPHMALVQAVG
jgi:hypothetical protein